MNILFFVLSFGLILSYSFYACWDKHISSDLLRKVYVGHEKTTRKLINTYASKIYEKLGSKVDTTENDEIEPAIAIDPKESKKKSPAPNGECAKINLALLLQNGKDRDSRIYKLARDALCYFYSKLNSDPDFPDQLLQAILIAAEKSKEENLSKLDLGNWQETYYKMLMGEKKNYPKLDHYFKIAQEPKCEFCYFHMHPEFAAFFFTDEVAWELHYEIHVHHGEEPSRDLIEKKCQSKCVTLNDPGILDLFRFRKRHPRNDKEMHHAEDANSDVAIAKCVEIR